MQARVKPIKRYLPRSLFGRALMILVAPVVVLQVIVASVLIDRYYENVTVQMAGDVARALDLAVREVEAVDTLREARAYLWRAEAPLGIEFRLVPDGRVEPAALLAFYDVTGNVVGETLRAGVSRPMTVDLVSVPKSAIARILTGKGVLEAAIPRRRLSPANPHQLMVLTNGAAVALVVIAIVFLRNQVRPIRELAQAAQAFGRGRHLAFRPSGAEEVRRAGHAFLDMRARIERQLQARTAMLSGVSHDLRTPLTRMKLGVAMMEPGEDRDGLEHDIAEMEAMIESFLDFARDGAGEEPAETDLLTLAEDVVVEACRAGQSVDFEPVIDRDAEVTLVVRRQALKRALANLTTNAVTHGGEALLTLRITRRAVEFVVEDDGPGIPPERREEMTRPFTRLDPSRGRRRQGGVGLGLSIALDVARGHGGALDLDESRRFGGLRATLRLPRSSAMETPRAA
ncbi:MAG: ATP-binding protein [Paracoccaceae bacterium]